MLQWFHWALVAVYNTAVKFFEALKNFGSWVDDLRSDLPGKESAPVGAAGEAFGQFANFVTSQIEALFASIHGALRALWDASAGAYLGGIEEALILAIEEFQMTGGISPSTAARLVAAFTAPLFWAIVGISVAVVAGYLVYAVSTLGLGVLLASVGLTIATALAWQVFGLAVTDFAIDVLFDPGATIGQLVSPFIDWYASVTWIDPSMESMWSAVLGAIFGLGSMIANSVVYAASDQSGSMATVWGLSLGIFSLVMSFGMAVGGAIGKAFAIVGGFFGFAGAFFLFLGRVKSPLYQIVNLAGATMAFTGAYLGVKYGLS